MAKSFGTLPNGQAASLYTIACGPITAEITDFGATLVRLWVPDKDGCVSDVVLGYDDVNGYLNGNCYFGAIVGRCANRIAGASFQLEGETIQLPANENTTTLHGGPDGFDKRM